MEKYHIKFHIVGGESISYAREYESFDKALDGTMSDMSYEALTIPVSAGHIVNLQTAHITHYEIMDEKTSEEYKKRSHEAAWGFNSYM